MARHAQENTINRRMIVLYFERNSAITQGCNHIPAINWVIYREFHDPRDASQSAERCESFVAHKPKYFEQIPAVAVRNHLQQCFAISGGSRSPHDIFIPSPQFLQG